MDTGDVFTPDGLTKDTEAIEDFYGSKGYIDIAQGQSVARAAPCPTSSTARWI